MVVLISTAADADMTRLAPAMVNPTIFTFESERNSPARSFTVLVCMKETIILSYIKILFGYDVDLFSILKKIGVLLVHK